MDNNVVTLNVSKKALIGSYVSIVSWALIWIVGAIVTFFTFAFPILLDGQVRYFRHQFLYKDGFDALGSLGQSTFALFCVPSFILSVFFVICVCFIVNNSYKAKEVNVFDKTKKTVTSTRYGFPYRKIVEEMKFDRITSISVNQGTFDRIFNTGSVSIDTLTYGNADTIENSWEIECIENPFEAKDRIMAGLPEYSGVEVVIKNDRK